MRIRPTSRSGIAARKNTLLLRLMLLALVVGAPAESVGAAKAHARPAGPIGPWIGRLPWINATRVSPESLSGKVVLVEFWAFDCINCRRTIPAMRQLAMVYRGRDFVILGMHTPELEQERDHALLRRQVEQNRITWPVAMDDDEVAWRAFDNHAWPALYLLDRSGRVQATHIGELHEGTPAWNELRRDIEQLLAARAPESD
jgi:thiol-disulfide isomerase/thioredoxin